MAPDFSYSNSDHICRILYIHQYVKGEIQCCLKVYAVVSNANLR
jgi:hypothetical protein